VYTFTFPLTGRKKNMILRGTQKIFPKGIEDILSEHPQVRDVAVVPMPCPVFGERVCAFVVPEGRKAPTVEDFAAFLAERNIAKFKWPERVELVDTMPLGPGGRLLRSVLCDNIAEKVKREIESMPLWKSDLL
jgi:non-ribosomal peptide synthetase component E (peptide arylation enzyme)